MLLDLSNIRREIDTATTVGMLDRASDPCELARMSRDALTEGVDREAEGVEILASIPPIKLGRTVYRVVTGSDGCLDLAGPRGGASVLVRSTNNPAAWSHNTYTGKSTWYRRELDGTFTRA